MRTIIVEPYNPIWPDEFMKIKNYLLPYVSDISLDIIHIGSTSVPGLVAKPIIDFNIIIESYDVFAQVSERLKKIGYEYESDGGLPTRERFKGGKRDGFMDYNLYVCPSNSLILKAQILFRDYLRRHSDARDGYATLKQSLARQHRHDIKAYVDGKHELIMKTVELAMKEKNLSMEKLSVLSPFSLMDS